MQERAPYNLIAEKWSHERCMSGFRERIYVDRLLERISPEGHILDLGCGSGIPITRYLVERRYQVTGIDSSSEMLRLARTNCPEAKLIAGDMTSIELSDRFHGIVAWDSIFHVPKAQHQQLFQTMGEWLRPGASVLLSLGGSEDEFTAPMFDVEFFFSGHSPEGSLVLLRNAGFEILCSEIDDPSSRGHLTVLCRKVD